MLSSCLARVCVYTIIFSHYDRHNHYAISLFTHTHTLVARMRPAQSSRLIAPPVVCRNLKVSDFPMTFRACDSFQEACSSMGWHSPVLELYMIHPKIPLMLCWFFYWHLHYLLSATILYCLLWIIISVALANIAQKLWTRCKHKWKPEMLSTN